MSNSNDWFFYKWDARYDEPVPNYERERRYFFMVPLVTVALALVALTLLFI